MQFILVEEEGTDDVSIELLPSCLLHQDLDLITGKGRTVDPVRGYGVKKIGNGDDAGAQGGSSTCQTLGVAVAIPFFVMAAGDLDSHFKEEVVAVLTAHRFQCLGADLGMGLYDHEFLAVQFPGLEIDGQVIDDEDPCLA